MPNIASALRAEIARVARKEVRGEVEALKKSSATYRHEIAALKKRLADLERSMKAATRKAPVMADAGAEPDKTLRFSATRFAAQRKKLGLSAANMAKLLGVSALSVYKWESGQTRPRQAQLVAIASARKLGKREVDVKLNELQAA